jgi:integrase
MRKVHPGTSVPYLQHRARSHRAPICDSSRLLGLPSRLAPPSRLAFNQRRPITSAIGTPLDRHNVRREFRKITKAAGLGTDWVPREMRHTFVSLLSSNGTALEDIADLVGHRGTATTETVYRKVIVPELRRGAEVMDRLFT